MAKAVHTHTFGGGMSSDLSPEAMPPDMYRYMLNCNVLSTKDGEVGIVTNLKGNVLVDFQLPPGQNRCIGTASDEETNNLYFALWNGNGYHGWYRYNSVDNAVVKVIQCITDTADLDIFQWKESDFILHANVIGNSLLYWTVSGSRHAPRKIDINKAMDKSDSGYGLSIMEEWTRAYKRTAVNAPFAEYFTDPEKKFNRLFGHQFQFAQRFIYDNHERSEVSDWSNVPNPDEEFFTGTRGVPERNNGIEITLETGSEIVVAIEVLMRKTNPEGGVLPWVSVVTLNKEFYEISSGSTYVYKFYNDGAYTSVDPRYPIRNNSSLPRDPFNQEFAKNALVYSNYHEGRPQVELETEWSVRYEDIFIDDSTEPGLNNPSFIYNEINRGWQAQSWLGGSGWRWTIGELIIGPDVKPGNFFTLSGVSIDSPSRRDNISFTATAGETDSNVTIANRLYNQLRVSTYFNPDHGRPGGYVNPVVVEGGNAVLRFRITARRGYGYWTLSTNDGNPVNSDTLKDTGQSVRNIKNGSSTKYGLVYRDEDGRKEAVQSNDELIIPIMTMNELGAIKRPIISLYINHKPPAWAKEFSIVRSKDLTRTSYLYMLIQKAIEIDTVSDKYYDLVVGSLFTYQQLHPNTILRYEFKKGDRIRVAYNYEDPDFVVATESKDFEIISYSEFTTEEVLSEVEVLGTNVVNTIAAEEENIGNYIEINGTERLIIDAVDGTSYSLNSDLPAESGSSQTFPSFNIINRRGVIRIKQDEDFPVKDLDIVEVYTPAVGDASVSENVFHEFGMRFDITDWGTDDAFHSGNIQNQTAFQPAIIEITNGSSYVRNRELPTNNNPKNPTVKIAVIEDPNYSDFYVSDLSDDGKANGLDQGQGEVLFGSRFIRSNNYIEGTRINGLNDFDALNREDYNDKYGDVMRIWFEDGRMIVFKYLKDAWMPIYGNIISDQEGSPLLAQSDSFFSKSLQYYLWDGGVGDNPESVARIGSQFFHVSPNSGIAARIGGNGVDPVSKIYSLDKEIRQLLVSASNAGASIIGGTDRERSEYNLTIPDHDNVIYRSPFNSNDWIPDDDFEPNQGPQVEAGDNQIIDANVVTLNGEVTAGTSPISSSVWTQVSGPSGAVITNPNNLTTTVTGLVEGIYVFRLTATDSAGLVGFDETQISVSISAMAYMGNLDSFRIPTISEIQSGTGVLYAGAGDVEYPAEELSSGAQFRFFAWPATGGAKSKWRDKFNLLNSGSIGGSQNLFNTPTTVGNLYVIVTNYQTEFDNPLIISE